MAGNDDNVEPLKKGQKPDILATARNAVDKARKESYEAKVKAKVVLLQEQEKAVRITKAEIDSLVEEFENGL